MEKRLYLLRAKKGKIMTLKEMIGTGASFLFIISILVQIAPIQLNPWTALARYIGRALNSEVMEKIDEGKAEAARYRIIRFNDEIRHDIKHTEEHFNQIIDDINTYKRYCKLHPNFPNGKAVYSVSNIEKIYQKCVEEDLFI